MTKDFEVMRQIAIDLMRDQMPKTPQGLMRPEDIIDYLFEKEMKKK